MTARVALPMLPGLSSATPLREADDDAYRPMDPALEEAIVREMADIYLMGMAVIDGFRDAEILIHPMRALLYSERMLRSHASQGTPGISRYFGVP